MEMVKGGEETIHSKMDKMGRDRMQKMDNKAKMWLKVTKMILAPRLRKKIRSHSKNSISSGHGQREKFIYQKMAINSVASAKIIFRGIATNVGITHMITQNAEHTPIAQHIFRCAIDVCKDSMTNVNEGGSRNLRWLTS